MEEQNDKVERAVEKESCTSRLEKEVADHHIALYILEGKVNEVEAQIATGLGDVRKEVSEVAERQENLVKAVKENGEDTKRNLQEMEKENKGRWAEIEKEMEGMV